MGRGPSAGLKRDRSMQQKERWAAHAFIDELLRAAQEKRAYDMAKARWLMGDYARIDSNAALRKRVFQ